MSVAIIEGDYGAVIVSGANLRLAGRTSATRSTSSNVQVFLCFKTRFLTPTNVFAAEFAKARRPGGLQRSPNSTSGPLLARTSIFWSSTPLRQR